MPPTTLRPDADDVDSRRHVRAVALDIGRVRIGVAIHDTDVGMAVADHVLQRKGTRRDIAQLQRRFDAVKGTLWVVGLPPQGPDPRTCSARLARNFAKALTAAQEAPVVLVDEANTSREAEDHLRLLGVRGRKLKEVIDKHAAARILDRWLAGASVELPTEPAAR